MATGLRYIALLITLYSLSFLLSGCASISDSTDSRALFIADDFSMKVEKELLVFSVIDARPDKDKDLKNIMGYAMLFSNIKSILESKGYAVNLYESSINSNSLNPVNNGNDLSWAVNEIKDNSNIVLLISVDSYTPPSSGTVSGIVEVTGILYEVKSKSILWKNTIRKRSGDEVLLFGIGGYFGALMVNAISPNITFRNSAFASMGNLIKTMPSLKRKETGS